MKAETVQIAWHYCNPVLSLHFHPVSGLLATAGADPDHDIKLWLLESGIKVTFEANLSYHSTTVNAVRFSPSAGEELASGADGGEIVLWRRTEGREGALAWKVFKSLRYHAKDVLDLGWSADGVFLASGSVDNSCIIWDIAKGAPLQVLADHLHYVQGVAWDPVGRYLTSISADRTCRIYSSSSDKTAYTCDHVIMKAELEPGTKSHLFSDETLPSFFRRLAWSPDGSFLITPAGVYKENGICRTSAFGFSRKDFSRPILHLPGNKAVVATAFCPVIFTLRGDTENCAFRLPYRLVFAVATLDSVAIYDTQKLKPWAFLAGIHYGPITDLAWSSDSKHLAVSSQDGYVTLIEFDDEELGEKFSFKAI